MKMLSHEMNKYRAQISADTLRNNSILPTVNPMVALKLVT
jgi:hypothetical protein